ncbi:penicillin-binding protein activator [Rhodanobacter sp. DHB23]|uniref:penicillin-binding protein activator n=1 Tax=Rhodanobacter sp. DHB23 TaxID=2775923 RepID=UPI0017816C34|nr:penicillin-binding protein activator [Rhodanobacter sp. DHB23]MBD8873449.1 penicillin-binding protein activator [Rhodanobacter sp. DHB23]
MRLRPVTRSSLSPLGPVLLLACTLVLSSCVPGNTKPSPAETAAADGAAALVRQGQFDQAAQAYLSLASQYGGHADQYRLLAAEAWREEGRIDAAAPTLAQIRRENLQGDDAVRYDLLRADLALQRHDAATALQLTTQPTVAVPEALQLRLFELRARAQAATDDHWGAARTRVQMDDHLQGLDRAENRKLVLAELAKLGVNALKQRAAAMQPGDLMLSWTNEALSQHGVAVAQPTPSLQQPVGTLLPGANADVREGYKMPARVALLLPQSGPYAAAGNTILEGFFAAYAETARTHAPRASVHIYDTQGDTDGAIKAYQQATKDGAQLVVGPLTRGAVAALFGQPALPVPVLALNHPDNKQIPSSGASEFGLLPETEGAQAADHMVDRGLNQAYVAISSDDFAQRAANAFKAELLARGGNVLGMATVPATDTNYASTIGQLNMANAGSDTGIFISMHPSQARLLVPQLQIAKITLPVFGTSHIYAGSDNPTADGDLNGVEFCDAPWLFNAQPGLPAHDDITTQLPSARAGNARLFAFGMDAWSLVPYLDWLRDHPGSYLSGATGQLTADQFGRIRRVLTWAKFDNGLARPLSGSLQLDDQPASSGSAPAPAGSSAQPAAASSAGN